MTDEKIHRNDIYGDLKKDAQEVEPTIPAATVVLLRGLGGW
ncbi:MAG TPA: hypothetical protein QF517_00530 [Pseudomonadales bacterium]|nr:hypothetical protein [Pseudomonadales bacterium]MDP6315639.1 hypothetical protein [Pseudomonadales bacterium]MDP7313551.1 hypothetical protein [Pseudomonadales bacterium]HJL60410.1 hypothetical protein [Pseudomonadales bacterium]HJP50602.1 hypothetical protein [Pseudomonadales bacterium]